MFNRYLEKAIQSCREHNHEKSACQKLCAVIVKGNKIISVGFNKAGTHPLIEEYRKHKNVCTIHAEVDAVLKARNKIDDLSGCKIYIARVRWNDTEIAPSIGLSKPCSMCHNILFDFGIKKVQYTLNDLDSYGMMVITKKKEIADDLWP